MKELQFTHHTEELLICSAEDAAGEDEIRTADSEKKPAHYAFLRFEQDHWTVEDVSTRFGVFLNGRKLSEKTDLHDEDRLRIGTTEFTIIGTNVSCNHQDYLTEKLSIRIRERTVRRFFRKKTLIKDISLDIFPGEMVLILGGSGAGKTTFLNAVIGYERADAEIRIGDHDVYEEYDQLKYAIGFVPQQDLLREEDTVFMTLMNAAELRLPSSFTAEDYKERVEKVMQLMSLSELRNEQIVKLSGGQRKRTSIAMEFVSDPLLFFLDEPDSGLDGVMARALMQNLRDMTDERHITVLISHQPDRVIDLFDRVIILAKSQKDGIGYLAFTGTPMEAKSFFGCEKMEDILKIIDRTDEGGDGRSDEFIEKYRAITGGSAYV